MSEDRIVWSLDLRPKTVQDCVIPQELKQNFQSMVDNKHFPNMLLSGPPGCGKTTVALALADELNMSYLFINGSVYGNIDTLRTKMTQFASTVSLDDKKKLIIIDEADYMNPQSMQPGLRNFMEDFGRECKFIFTCNYKNKILKALHSRCSVIDFTFPKEEKATLVVEFFNKIAEILDKEGIKYEKKPLIDFIMHHYPDFRNVLNELQRFSIGGELKKEQLQKFSNVNLDTIIGMMRSKDFAKLRKWVAEHPDIDFATLSQSIYKTAGQYFKPVSIPNLIMLLAQYQYQAAFVADPEINTMACLTHIMMECQLK